MHIPDNAKTAAPNHVDSERDNNPVPAQVKTEPIAVVSDYNIDKISESSEILLSFVHSNRTYVLTTSMGILTYAQRC